MQMGLQSTTQQVCTTKVAVKAEHRNKRVVDDTLHLVSTAIERRKKKKKERRPRCFPMIELQEDKRSSFRPTKVLQLRRHGYMPEIQADNWSCFQCKQKIKNIYKSKMYASQT